MTDEPLELGEPDSLKGTFWDELCQLREFRNFIFDNCYGIDVNANDLFDYAVAESIHIPSDDLDIYWMAHRKFGWEGEVAFMRLCAVRYNKFTELPEPLSDYFSRGMMDKDKYEAAKAWLDEIQCECRNSDDKELRIDHIEYNKHCQFGWKIHRPMYDEPKEEGDDVEAYW